VIRNGFPGPDSEADRHPKIELIGPWAMPYLSKKFRQNRLKIRSQLFQLSDGQTDRRTETKNITSLGGGNKPTNKLA